MSTNRIIAIVGLVGITVGALISGGVEAALFTGGFSAVGYATLTAAFTY